MRAGSSLRYAVLCAQLALAACGGSGSPTPTPAPPAYTVGGNVTGLSGALVLRNNGADDLSVTSNDGFTFKSALQAAAGYAVTVAAQPANQTCSVANGTGTIGSANVTNVAVTCISAPPPGPSGTLDTSFGAGGKVTTDFSGAPPAAASAPISSAKPTLRKAGRRS